MKIVSRSVQKN